MSRPLTDNNRLCILLAMDLDYLRKLRGQVSCPLWATAIDDAIRIREWELYKREQCELESAVDAAQIGKSLGEPEPNKKKKKGKRL